ncbi:MAG: F0F1 ATP synthase subunit B [Lewinellaceae bacterium]|nr:F0F1 ATP synthase subunit B [Lewinellaceae bacterium]
MIFLSDFSVIKPEPGLIFWTTLIFLLFWFLMSKFAFKPIASALKKREMDIQEALDQAKQAREEMANLHAENEKLLAAAREERAMMLKEAKEAGEKFKAEMADKANTEYKRKVESAIQDIENQKQAALVDLKNQAGQMAIEIAEKLLQKDLGNNPDQIAFAKSMADQIKLN